MKPEDTATADPAADAAPVDLQRVHLHMPVDVRNLALVILAVIASLYALQWAKAVFIPLLLGVMLSYALTPAIERLVRWRVPRAAGAGLLLAAIVAGFGWGAWAVSDDANALIETLPEVAQKLRKSVQKPGPRTNLFRQPSPPKARPRPKRRQRPGRCQRPPLPTADQR